MLINKIIKNADDIRNYVICRTVIEEIKDTLHNMLEQDMCVDSMTVHMNKLTYIVRNKHAVINIVFQSAKTEIRCGITMHGTNGLYVDSVRTEVSTVILAKKIYEKIMEYVKKDFDNE